MKNIILLFLATIISFLLVRESHLLNPEIQKYDETMKAFEATGRRIKQGEKAEDHIGGPSLLSKRESGFTTLGSVETVETTTPDFIATPITGPFLEPAYLDCLMEAKWQLDDQRFHIRFTKQSYNILSRRGMKMPEFERLLTVIEEFYNHTIVLVGQKMRDEEDSDEKYDPTYKLAFLRLYQCWNDLIEYLDKQTPKYHTENRIKRMREEMSTAANTSHDTYYLISEMQMNMATTSPKPLNQTRPTLKARESDESASIT